ncbi:protein DETOXIFICATION 16 isoform X1 [Zea mays]|uniref:Protein DETOXIFICATION n=2 Tax=Zea mays TaxID=4577 RepID=A0A1D6H4R9_MAIZE|nr:protein DETOXIFICATION 16 isoform X1 [Zea mays]AQK69818.1 Protein DETOXIFICATION 16 [Zea mays]|eukprot:XP_008645475.1 protein DETOXIFICATION 16 isoform X1 [Zea mays]
MEAALLAAAGTGRKDGGSEESGVVCEVKKQLYLAGPLVVGFLLQNTVQMVSVMFVGHLGELALASASLATSFAGVTGFSLLAGMACSLDTLCGQAFGARQHHLLGVHKQRAMLVLALVSVPVALVWAYTGDILAWCGQDPEIAAGAGSYIRCLIPAMVVYGALQCHVRFLQTQNLVVPVMLSSGATALCHPAVCWLLVRGLGLGCNGAALANAVSYLANLSFLAVYVRVAPACKATWTGFSAEAFRGVPDFLRLAVPSAVMVCMEWWSFELLVLLSGLLPNPKLETAVLSICLNTSSLAFMAPLGLGAAISTRVSNELGAGRPHAARLAARVVVLLALIVGTSEALVIVLVRDLWGYAYSSEEEVARYTARMMPVLAVSVMLDGQQCVLSGVVRGCGRQKAGAFINLAAYYLAGIPAALAFAFVRRLAGMGLWFGILCGLVVQMLSLLSVTLCTDWNKEALKAKNRVFSVALPADMET